MPDKLCSSCNRYKDVTEYYKDGHGGYRKQCKECTTERDRVWRQTNKERCAEQKKEERQRNKGRYRVYAHRRIDRLADLPGELPENHWQLMIDHYGERCMKPGCSEEITEKNPLTLDHVIPVSWEGSSHTLRNCQILCLHHNCSKSNRHAEDYRDWIIQGILIGDGVVEWAI